MRMIHRVLGCILIAVELYSIAVAEMTCDISTVSRRRCGNRAILKSACESLGCCFNPKISVSYSLRCYMKKDITRGFIRFGATRRTPTGPRNPVGPNFSRSDHLQFGGEPGFPGSMAIFTCNLRRIRNPYFRCNPGIVHDVYSCNRMGCCFFEGDPTADPPIPPICYRSSYFVYSLRTTCGPGLEAPPRCDDIDDCSPNPCANEGVCIDGLDKFECRCPGQITGTLCQDVCLIEPFIPTSGTIVGNSGAPYALGHFVDYSCPSGTVADPTTLRSTCLISGQWSQPTGPSCRIVCSPPPNNPIVSTPDVVKTVYEVFDRVTFNCIVGNIVLNTPGDNLCMGNGQWLYTNPPQCTVCPDPPPTRSYLTFTSPTGPYPIGSSVMYTCASGTLLSGQQVNRCFAPNVWEFDASGTSAANNILVCGCPADSEAILFADFTPSVAPHEEGAQVTYTCQAGRTLVPPADGSTAVTSTCTGGVWSLSGMTITCEQECTGPVPNNGLLSVDNPGPYLSTTTITYSCTSGNALTGTTQNTCNDGTWSVTDTTTLLECGCSSAPDALTNGMFNGVSSPYTEGMQATYSCSPTYVTSDPAAVLTSTCTNGVWTLDVTTIQCVLGCQNLPITAELVADPASGPYRPNDIVTYSCMTGVSLGTGADMNTCQTGGAWTAPLATDLLKCGCTNSPAPLTDGTFTTPAVPTVLGTVVDYSCTPPNVFDVPATTMSICQDGNQWSLDSNLPVCVFGCGDPPTRTGVLNVMGTPPYGINDQVTYTCDTGMVDTGETMNTCTAGGWMFPMTSIATCLSECARPASGTGLTITPADASFPVNTNIVYECDPTFLLDPALPTTFTCQGVTFLFNFPGGVAPVCKKECTAVPVDVVNANPVDQTSPFLDGDTRTYVCIADHRFVGTTDINMCGSDGIWTLNASPPECKRICSDPMVLNSGSFADVAAEYLDGTVITYTCDSTHIFSDPAQVDTSTCSADGSWTLESPLNVFPSCVLANEDIDLVIIMDSTTHLDDCVNLQSTFNLLPPYDSTLTPTVYNTGALPNFFQQVIFVESFINTYRRFTTGRSRISLIQHNDACDPANMPTAYDLTSPVANIFSTYIPNLQYLCGSYQPLAISTACSTALLDRGAPSTNKRVTLFISSDVSTITATLPNFITQFDALRLISPASLQNFLTISVLPTTHADYPNNESFLKNIACGDPVTCNRFLGSTGSGAAAAIALMDAITFV